MKGDITVTDLRGGIIFSANIWIVMAILLASGKWAFMIEGIRVFIDGDEAPKPEGLVNDTKGRG